MQYTSQELFVGAIEGVTNCTSDTRELGIWPKFMLMVLLQGAQHFVIDERHFEIDAGTDVALSAGAALVIKVGGAYSSKAGGDFGISGTAVTLKVSKLTMKAGGSSIEASSGKIELNASKLGGEGVKILLKGDVDYV